MVIVSASQTKGSQGVNKRTTLGNPVRAKSSSSSFSRSAVALAVKNASNPVVLPPVTKPTGPRLEVATSVATHVNGSLGLPKGKAKALGLAVTEAVVKAVPKNIPARAIKDALAKVTGPPPDVVHHVVPIGLLGSVAATMPPVSEQVVVQALVKLSDSRGLEGWGGDCSA